MADDNKQPEGGSSKPEGGGSDVTKRLDELEARNTQLQSLVDKYSAEAEEYRKAKQESEQAARERERKALEEQGQFKTIAEQTQQELDRIKAEQEAIKARAEAAEAQLKARDDAERAAILETIPEPERAKWQDRPLDVLRDVAPMYGQANGKTPSKAPASGKYAAGPVDFSDMTETEQIAYARDHNMTPVQIAEARMKARNKKR